MKDVNHNGYMIRVFKFMNRFVAVFKLGGEAFEHSTLKDIVKKESGYGYFDWGETEAAALKAARNNVDTTMREILKVI